MTRFALFIFSFISIINAHAESNKIDLVTVKYFPDVVIPQTSKITSERVDVKLLIDKNGKVIDIDFISNPSEEIKILIYPQLKLAIFTPYKINGVPMISLVPYSIHARQEINIQEIYPE